MLKDMKRFIIMMVNKLSELEWMMRLDHIIRRAEFF